MAKQPFSPAKFFMNSLLALMSFVFVDMFSETNPRMSTSFMMLIGTYYLIIIMKFLFLHRKHSMTAAYFLFYTGLALVIIFVVWLGNWLLSLAFNVGHLFPGIFNFACSLPALICGLILMLSGTLWEHSDSRLNSLKNALLSGK